MADVPQKQYLSLKAYGRHRGCSDTAVKKAIEAGKIIKGYVSVPGREHKMIDWKVADAEWKSNSDTNTARHDGLLDNAADAPVDNADSQAETAAVGVSAATKQAREDDVIARAKLRQLELEEKMGRLVNREDVDKEIFKLGATLRNNLLKIPDRFIADILSAPNMATARIILTDAITDALEQFANNPSAAA